MSWLALAGAILGAGANIYSQQQANKARDSQIDDILKRYASLKGEAKASGAAAMGYLRGAQKTIGQGFDQAAGFIRGASRSSEIQAQDQSAQLMAQIERDLISQGRYSTDALQWARIGVSQSTSRVLSDIASRTSEALASLSTQRAGAEAGLQTAMAQQENLNFANAAGLGQGQIQAVGADIPQAQGYGQQIGVLFQALDRLWGSGSQQDQASQYTQPTRPLPNRGLDLPSS